MLLLSTSAPLSDTSSVRLKISSVIPSIALSFNMTPPYHRACLGHHHAWEEGCPQRQTNQERLVVSQFATCLEFHRCCCCCCCCLHSSPVYIRVSAATTTTTTESSRGGDKIAWLSNEILTDEELCDIHNR